MVVDIARPPEVCWQALVDVTRFGEWMPGLRAARVVATGGDGLPLEVEFDFSSALTYSLRYQYDAGHREVHWQPHTGTRDAVRGFARFEPHGAGTRMTYRLEQGAGRRSGDLIVGGAHPIVTAFVRWLEGR